MVTIEEYYIGTSQYWKPEREKQCKFAEICDV
jgi:hypothetical protein